MQCRSRPGAPIGQPLQHTDTVLVAAFDPTGERVVTGSRDKTARISSPRAADLPA